METKKTKKTKEKKIPSCFFENCVGESYKEVYIDFLNLKNFKKGDVFYECNFKSGKNYELKLKENPTLINEGVECIVESLLGEELKIYISGNTEYKIFNFFKIPQNLTKIDENKYVYVIS